MGTDKKGGSQIDKPHEFSSKHRSESRGWTRRTFLGAVAGLGASSALIQTTRGLWRKTFRLYGLLHGARSSTDSAITASWRSILMCNTFCPMICALKVVRQNPQKRFVSGWWVYKAVFVGSTWIQIEWPGTRFGFRELTDPYHGIRLLKIPADQVIGR